MSDDVLRYKVDQLILSVDALTAVVKHQTEEISSNREEIVKLQAAACQYDREAKRQSNTFTGLMLTVVAAVLAVWKFGMP